MTGIGRTAGADAAVAPTAAGLALEGAGNSVGAGGAIAEVDGATLGEGAEVGATAVGATSGRGGAPPVTAPPERRSTRGAAPLAGVLGFGIGCPSGVAVSLRGISIGMSSATGRG